MTRAYIGETHIALFHATTTECRAILSKTQTMFRSFPIELPSFAELQQAKPELTFQKKVCRLIVEGKYVEAEYELRCRAKGKR